MKILITGSEGFIGRNIVEQIGNKYNFLTPSREELDLLDFDKVSEYLEREKPELILHLASVGVDRMQANLPDVAYANIRMFINLVQCKNYFKRMIVLGSGAEYGKSRPLVNAKESDFGQNIPQDQYGFSKYVCSLLAKNADFITHLRLFGVFGKCENYKTRFISNAICKALYGLPITINQNVFFDYMHIDDFVKILDYFISNTGKEKFYNIGTGQKIDLLTLANKIKEISGQNVEIIVKNKGLGNEYTCDMSRLKAEMPQINFRAIDEGIKNLAEYYRLRLEQIARKDLLSDK